MIRVCIVDDHWVVRHGLEAVLETAEDVELVGVATGGHESLGLVSATNPDVVLMDLSMPEGGGLEAIRTIMVTEPSTRIVVLSTFGETQRVLSAMDAGAVGYLLKDCTPDDLLKSIRQAAHGLSPLDPRAATALVDARQSETLPVGLSEREVEVLKSVMSGLSNKQIALSLQISQSTVKSHLTRIYERIGVTDRTQAALWGNENLL